MLKIKIPGEPIAKKRPRFARRGKFVTTYNDQQTEEGKFIQQALFQIGKKEPLREPILIDMDFYKSRPKSHYGTGRNAGKIKKSSPRWPITKPDIDNYIKFVLDCLNGVAWTDDSLVVLTKAGKFYSEKPRTEISISLI